MDLGTYNVAPGASQTMGVPDRSNALTGVGSRSHNPTLNKLAAHRLANTAAAATVALLGALARPVLPLGKVEEK